MPRRNRTSFPRFRLLAMLVVVAAALAPLGSPRAQPVEAIPLEDILEIVVLERQLLAISATGGGQTQVGIELGEQILWTGSRGRVGIVLSDRRILAVTDRSAAWQETRYRRTESPPADVLFGDRVALMSTRDRVIGLDGGSGNLIEYRLGPQERVLDARVGANVAVAITSREAIGLSPRAGGFFPVAINLKERIESISAKSDIVTITTNRRLLIFRSPTGSWEVRRLNLR
jgi:hypothetical protein